MHNQTVSIVDSPAGEMSAAIAPGGGGAATAANRRGRRRRRPRESVPAAPGAIAAVAAPQIQKPLRQPAVKNRQSISVAATVPKGVLTLSRLQRILFSGAERIDARLRRQAKKDDSGELAHRTAGEIVYQWNFENSGCDVRLYTTIKPENRVTSAEDSGAAVVRIVFFDQLAKRRVNVYSAHVMIERNDQTWEERLFLALSKPLIAAMLPRPQCPQCRGAMITKERQRGEYWSCQNYPKCGGSRGLKNFDLTGGGGSAAAPVATRAGAALQRGAN